MTDADLIAAIEAKTLPLSAFTHTEHVHLAWSCLRAYPLLMAMGEFRRLLVAYATHNGKPTLYHETVTFAYMLLLYERMARTPQITNWEVFSREHGDLLSWHNGPFFKYYSPDILKDAAARAHFVLPATTRS